MTAKEKAKQLLWKYLPILESWKDDNSDKAKKCAKIAVEEILIELESINFNYDLNLTFGAKYWNEVLKEIDLI